MGGIYNNNYRSIVTSGITLNNGTATVENESNVSIFTLGGSNGSWTFNDGSYYLANNSSSQLNSVTSATNDNAKWIIEIELNGNNTTITNKQNTSHKIFYNSGSYYSNFNASTSGTAVQLYVEDNGGSVIPTTVAAPTFSPAGGTYSVAQTVTITTTTSGATIYYTTDGTTPTSSSTRYTAAITVSTTTTIKAIAVKDGVSSAVATATFTINSGSTTDDNVNRNALSSKYNKDKYMWRLEWPRINETDNNTWVIKSTSEYGVTFSLEWSNSLIANRWTCYYFDSKNIADNVSKRADSFREDEELPSATRSTLSDYKNSGYSRGHLCPSADRSASQTVEDQTYVLSNMQPQWQGHNGGQWSTLETDVRNWAQKCDTLYVVKAATIGDISINGTTESGIYSINYNGTTYEDLICNNRLPVAKYFYMALLAYNKSTDSYQAMGIWTKHYNGGTSGADQKTHDWPVITRESAEYISIDELEARTGIDFFCNLPDDVENQVESSFNSGYWSSSNTPLTR